MTKEETLYAAVDALTEATPLEEAMRDVLHEGLAWFDDFRYDQSQGDYRYADGRLMDPERMYTLSPEGRATVALAEAILNERAS